MIGRKLAEKLNVHLGEKIVIMAQAADGELGTAAYRVDGKACSRPKARASMEPWRS